MAAVEGVSFLRGERPIIRELTTSVMRGDRIGIIGPNGSGKTTLLRLLLGELAPAAGTVLVVSHDRAFLDNVVTSTLVFEPTGDVLARDQARLRDLESRLAEAFARWEALEGGNA